MGILSSEINRSNREWCLKNGSVDMPRCRDYYIENPNNELISNIIIFSGFIIVLLLFKNQMLLRIGELIDSYKNQIFRKDINNSTNKLMKKSLIMFVFSLILLFTSLLAIDINSNFIYLTLLFSISLLVTLLMLLFGFAKFIIKIILKS